MTPRCGGETRRRLLGAGFQRHREVEIELFRHAGGRRGSRLHQLTPDLGEGVGGGLRHRRVRVVTRRLEERFRLRAVHVAERAHRTFVVAGGEDRPQRFENGGHRLGVDRTLQAIVGGQEKRHRLAVQPLSGRVGDGGEHRDVGAAQHAAQHPHRLDLGELHERVRHRREHEGRLVIDHRLDEQQRLLALDQGERLGGGAPDAPIGVLHGQPEVGDRAVSRSLRLRLHVGRAHAPVAAGVIADDAAESAPGGQLAHRLDGDQPYVVVGIIKEQARLGGGQIVLGRAETAERLDPHPPVLVA